MTSQLPSLATLGLVMGNHTTGVVRMLVGVGYCPDHGLLGSVCLVNVAGEGNNSAKQGRRVGVLSQTWQLPQATSPVHKADWGLVLVLVAAGLVAHRL